MIWFSRGNELCSCDLSVRGHEEAGQGSGLLFWREDRSTLPTVPWKMGGVLVFLCPLVASVVGVVLSTLKPLCLSTGVLYWCVTWMSSHLRAHVCVGGMGCQVENGLLRCLCLNPWNPWVGNLTWRKGLCRCDYAEDPVMGKSILGSSGGLYMGSSVSSQEQGGNIRVGEIWWCSSTSLEDGGGGLSQ